MFFFVIFPARVLGPIFAFLFVGIPLLLGVSSCVSAYPQMSNYIGAGVMAAFFGFLVLTVPLLLWRERHEAFKIPPRQER